MCGVSEGTRFDSLKIMSFGIYLSIYINFIKFFIYIYQQGGLGLHGLLYISPLLFIKMKKLEEHIQS